MMTSARSKCEITGGFQPYLFSTCVTKKTSRTTMNKRLGDKVENSFDPTVKKPTHNIIFDAILNVEVCLEILLFDESHVQKHQCYRKSVEERLFAFLANFTKNN